MMSAQETTPGQALSTASQLAKGNVTLHVVPAGGGFGRRNKPDYVEEAVQISQAAGAPVQVFWTREDEFFWDTYRPAAVVKIRSSRRVMPSRCRNTPCGSGPNAACAPTLCSTRSRSSNASFSRLSWRCPEASLRMERRPVPRWLLLA